MTAPVIDLSELSLKEAHQRLGELLLMLIQRSRAAIFVSRIDGVITTLDPEVLSEVSSEELAVHLLNASWDEESIEEFLETMEQSWKS